MTRHSDTVRRLVELLRLEPFRYYLYGRRTVHLDGCVEVAAAYYSARRQAGSGVDPTMPSYSLNAKGNLDGPGHRLRGRAVRNPVGGGPEGTGNAVANHDGVVVDEHLLDEKPHDPLPFHDVECLSRRPQARQKRREAFGEMQMRGAVAKSVPPARSTSCLLALTQQRHPLA